MIDVVDVVDTVDVLDVLDVLAVMDPNVTWSFFLNFSVFKQYFEQNEMLCQVHIVKKK